jgi:transcriptional regulator with XRE-family HTH domain
VPQLRNQHAINILAEKVRKHRIAQELSQEALANMAGIEFSTISRIERGVMNTSISVIFAIADALNIKPSLLIDE